MMILWPWFSKDLKAQPKGAKIDQFVVVQGTAVPIEAESGAERIYAKGFSPSQCLLYGITLSVEDTQAAEDGKRLGKVGDGYSAVFFSAVVKTPPSGWEGARVA